MLLLQTETLAFNSMTQLHLCPTIHNVITFYVCSGIALVLTMSVTTKMNTGAPVLMEFYRLQKKNSTYLVYEIFSNFKQNR